MAKKREYLFTIKFNPAVPGHIEAAGYLNSLGRTKADMIARALIAAGFAGGGDPTGYRPVAPAAPQESEKVVEVVEREEPELIDTSAAKMPESIKMEAHPEKAEPAEKDTTDDGDIPEEYRDTLMANLNYFDSMESDEED